MVNELNHMCVWYCFEEPFLTLVKQIGKKETQSYVLVIHRKWIPVPIGDSSIQDPSPILLLIYEYITSKGR
jgi:hypothetical protein